MEPAAEEKWSALQEPLVSRRFSSVEPAPQRQCRDVTWLLVFLLYWAGMLWIASCSVAEGDLTRLYSGLDDENQLCGAAAPGQYDLADQPYLYFACLQYGSRRPSVCMSGCPMLSGHYVRWYNSTLIQCEAHGRTIPATTYPTTNLGHSCVPAEATLYVLVSAIIDESAFTSVISGMCDPPPRPPTHPPHPCPARAPAPRRPAECWVPSAEPEQLWRRS